MLILVRCYIQKWTEEDYWYENGQKELERRYNENGTEIAYDRWYDNGQKEIE